MFTRELKPKTVRGNFFSLLEGPFDLSGTATDPLFLIASNKDVFLSAYNDAPLIYHFYDHPSQVRRVPLSNAKNSHRWFSLTKEDLQFIKKTMIKDYPKDWKRIKKRLFLDQTQTPYFK